MMLETLRKHMSLVGFLAIDSSGYKKALIIACNCGYLAGFCILWTTTSWYIAFEAKEPLEYAVSSFFVVLSTAMMMLYLLMFSVRKEYLELFNDMDILVERSMYRMKGETWTKTLHDFEIVFIIIRKQSGFKNWIHLKRNQSTYWKCFENNEPNCSTNFNTL